MINTTSTRKPRTARGERCSASTRRRGAGFSFCTNERNRNSRKVSFDVVQACLSSLSTQKTREHRARKRKVLKLPFYFHLSRRSPCSRRPDHGPRRRAGGRRGPASSSQHGAGGETREGRGSRQRERERRRARERGDRWKKKHRRRPTSPSKKKNLSFQQQEQPGALRLTGILGLAAALYLWWAVGGGGGGGGAPRPPPRPSAGESEEEAATTTTTSTSTATAATTTKTKTSLSTAAASTPVNPATLAARAALRGASTVSVSAPGVLLRECEGGGLESGATPRAGAVEALRALASAASGGVFLVCRVVGDVGEAAARGALEAAGAVGPPPAPVPPQRLLFCETAGGKIATVRALEPGLHVDAEPGTLDGLARFVPRLALVSSQSASASCDGGRGGSGGGGGGVSSSAPLARNLSSNASASGGAAAGESQQQLGDGRWPSAPSLAALLGLAG